MDKLKKLREERQAAFDKMEEMLALADSEERDLTDEETTEYESLEKDYEKKGTDIGRVEKQLEREVELKESTRNVFPDNAIIKPGDTEEIRGIGELLYLCRFHPQNEKLIELRAEQSMGEGTAGGFAIPDQFLPGLFQVSAQDAIVRPRATVLPAGTPPDSEITMPILNQGSGQNMYGGVEVTWIKEGATKSATDFKLKELTLTPHEVAATIVVTDKLLRNWPACNVLCETLLRKATIAAEDFAFCSGDGVAKPHGYIHSGATIAVPRAVATQIAFADIRDMYVRLLRRGGSPVWVYSQTALPQLISMVDPGSAGTLVWMPSARDGEPDRLIGIPAIMSERSPGLGSLGDIALVDLSYYLIKDGSGPFVDASPHVYFETNKTVIKIFWNVDGDSWLDEPIPLEGSTANTISPFVLLAE